MTNIDQQYPETAVDRMMKIQEVILRAVAGTRLWWQVAEIIGVSHRTMRRWRARYEEHGYDGLYDRRRGQITDVCLLGLAVRRRGKLATFDRSIPLKAVIGAEPRHLEFVGTGILACPRAGQARMPVPTT